MLQLNDFTSYLGLTKKKVEPLSSNLDSVPKLDPKTYGEKVVEYTWTAPSRVIKEMSPKGIRTLIVIGISVALLFALMQEFVLIIVIACTGFLAYMLSKTPATQVTHEVSTHGLLYAGEQFYYWHEFKHFFFKGDTQSVFLCVDTIERLPGRIFLNINVVDKEKLKAIFSKRLVFLEEEPRGVIDKLYTSAISKFSLDK